MRKARRHLLVIEDHRDMARFLAEKLAPAYRVVLAEDGQDGLEKASSSNRSHLVI